MFVPNPKFYLFICFKRYIHLLTEENGGPWPTTWCINLYVSIFSVTVENISVSHINKWVRLCGGLVSCDVCNAIPKAVINISKPCIVLYSSTCTERFCRTTSSVCTCSYQELNIVSGLVAIYLCLSDINGILTTKQVAVKAAVCLHTSTLWKLNDENASLLPVFPDVAMAPAADARVSVT